MPNEQYLDNSRINELTLGDILRAVFCKKILMLIIVAVITLVGTLSIVYGVDKSRQIYTARFNINAIDLEDSGTYIDGSNFDYRNIISLANLNKVKESDEKFKGINTEGIVASGAISITQKTFYDEDILEAEKKAVIKEQYYEITLTKGSISNASLAKEFIESLVDICITDSVAKVEALDYTSNLFSYDTSNKYDAQIEYLQNQYDFITEGYEDLISNYGNVLSNDINLTSYNKKVQKYFEENAFSSLKNELNQYGYIKDYDQTGRTYSTAVNSGVDSYKVGKLKLDQLIAQRDEILNKYSSMGGSIENTGLDTIYVQIADLSTQLEDTKQNIRINLRRLANNYAQGQLETEFAEALSIVGLADATTIYAEIARGDKAAFEVNLAEFRAQLAEFTNEYKVVIKNVVSTCSEIYYKDASVIVVSGGLGKTKALLISFVAGLFIACVVNLILGREMLTYEYRLKRAIDRQKQYGLLINKVKEEAIENN